MKVNNKGMTLIEVVVSLLILSTASLIMVMGFTTAINMFSDSNSYKDAVNEDNYALKTGDTNGTNVFMSEEKAKYVIIEENGKEPIEVKGEVKKAKNESENDVTLQLFKNGKADDSQKGRTVYQRSCDMVKSIFKYLESKNNSSFSKTTTLSSSLVTNNINEWLQKNNKNGSINNFIQDFSKLYSIYYGTSVQVDSLADEVEINNNDYRGEIRNNYCEVMPCLYLNNYYLYTDFFYNENYKNLIYVTLGDYNTLNRPTYIYALFDKTCLDTSPKSETDHWLISNNAASTDLLQDKIYSTFYTKVPENWIKYITKK